MLNLDLAQTQNGLIPNKTLYPLHVPLGGLKTKTIGKRRVLDFQPGQGLDIPHSSLLDPNEKGWVMLTRIRALTDGIVLSQHNSKVGYTIYIKDGSIHAAVKTADSSFVLKESADYGITHCHGKWVSIELRIQPDRIWLGIDRRRVAEAPLENPLKGNDLRIRLGQQRHLPTSLQLLPDASPDGFAGAMASLKMVRQAD